MRATVDLCIPVVLWVSLTPAPINVDAWYVYYKNKKTKQTNPLRLEEFSVQGVCASTHFSCKLEFVQFLLMITN